MTTIRALVVDDQPLARERLIALLSGEPDVRVIGIAASGTEAVEKVEALKPDLVFLDMQMPELDGFGVIDAVGAAHMPPTIFVTAYDEYAVRAFEVHALDYLLKPFGRTRFQKALSRARAQIQRDRGDEIGTRLQALVNELRGPAAQGGRLMVRSGGRVLFVDLDRIDWIEAEGNYVRVKAGDGSYLLRETMASVMGRIGDEQFFRIHRSCIVNLARVQELKLAAGGDYSVILTTGATLRLSRLYKDALQERLARGR